MLLANFPLMNAMWLMIVFFAWVIWISVLIMILIDNFRRTDTSGWAKALWLLLIIFLPVIGVCAYLIARPNAMESTI